MERESTELLLRDASRAVLVPADHPHATKVALDACGIGVMTDLDRTPAVTVDDGTQIDEALRLMKDTAVRSAFVIDGGCNVLGLITAYDVVGDKPLRYLDSLGCTLRTCSRADVRVGDIMEPVDRWLVIDVADLAA
jgi:CBS domain-containing protein